MTSLDRQGSGSRRVAAWAAGVAAALLSVACQQETPVDGSALHLAKPIADNVLALELDGLTANPRPDKYHPKVAWLPLRQVAEEGAEVTPGDMLFDVDLAVVRLWMNDRELWIQREEARLRQQRLRMRRRIDDVRAKRRQARSQRQVVEAAIDATHERDAESLRLAELAVDQARSRLAQTERAFARVQALHQAGVTSDERLNESRADLAAARDRVRVPNQRLDVLRTSTMALTRALLELDRREVALDLDAPDVADDRVDRMLGRVEIEGHLAPSISTRLMSRTTASTGCSGASAPCDANSIWSGRCPIGVYGKNTVIANVIANWSRPARSGLAAPARCSTGKMASTSTCARRQRRWSRSCAPPIPESRWRCPSVGAI